MLTRGLISGIDTDPFFTDSTTYLSDVVSGEMMSTPPTSLGSYTVSIGRVLVSSASGKMYITFDRNNNLTDLADVDISSPILDQVLRYNGAYWINGAETSTSPSVGANFFLDNTVVIPEGSGPQSIETFSLLKNPTVTSENILDATVNNSTALIKYFMYDRELGGSFIDAGNWNFKTYASVSQTLGETSVPITVRKIVAQTGVIDIMGIGTSRTAYAVNKFLPSDFNADITLATYIQTPNALLRITGYSNTNSVSVETLSTYVNETSVSFSKHINIFEETPSEVNSSLPILISSESTRAPYAINPTDKLAIAYYARTDSNINTTVSLYINGVDTASYLTTPIAVRHNDLIGLQGGSASERFHLTLPQYNTVLNTSGVNTGDQDLSSYELNLNKSTSVITDQASNTKYPSVKSVYDWATSTFESGIGYTAENVANKATDLTSPNNTNYPTTLAVQNAIDLLPTVHSELTGLSADDHTQYIRTDGTRAFTGDQSLGNNALTDVSLVNGIVIEDHSSRHLPNGADPLTTGTPSTIGTSNSEGTANSFARQDHVHSHGDQTSPTHHAIATALSNGFMSSTDKNKLDTVESGATANSTDAQLRDRSTHTGTQSYTTITGLGALANKNTISTSDIIDGNVTNAKLTDMAAFTIKGNSTISPAAPQDLSISSTKNLLSINNVDNTSDLSKPISTATQNALDQKLNISGGTLEGTLVIEGDLDGTGNINLKLQSSYPVTPPTGVALFADQNENFSWKGQVGHPASFDINTFSEERTFILPDSNGTILLDPTTTNGDMIYRNSGAPTRLPIGSAGQVLKVTSSLPSWVDEGISGFFGGRSDGNLTLNGSLSQPAAIVYYDTLTLQSLGVLRAESGFPIFCRVLDLSNSPVGGIVSTGNNGNAGVNNTAGSGGGARFSTYLGGGTGAGAGSAGAVLAASTPSSTTSAIPSNGGNGGSGGAGGAGSSGAGGAQRAFAPVGSSVVFSFLTKYFFRGASIIVAGGQGPGGGGGGGDGVNSGGGGGGGGSTGYNIAIYAEKIITSASTPSGAIRAIAGNGGNGATRTVGNVGGGAGGGGGGGPYVYIAYAKKTGPVISDLIQSVGGNGGNGGNGVGSGIGGNGGNGGSSGYIQLVNVTTGENITVAPIAGSNGTNASGITGGIGGAGRISGVSL